MKKLSSLSRPLVALATLALALPLAACSSLSGAHSDSTAGDSALGDSALGGSRVNGTNHATAEQSPLIPFDGSVPDSSGAEQQDIDGAQADRSIVKSGSIEIEVASLETGVQAVADLAERLGGSVSSQYVSEHSGTTRNGYLSINVPAERFDDVFTQLAELGTVRSDERSTDDVTTEHVDLQARVAALQTSVDRLNDLLASAASTSDLLEIESMLAERQANLDGLQAQLQALEGRVAESNIQVMLTEPSVLPGGGPQSFWDALGVGLASIGSFAASTVIILGVALPWIVILTVIAAAIVIPLRIRRKRRASTRVSTESVANLPEG